MPPIDESAHESFASASDAWANAPDEVSEHEALDTESAPEPEGTPEPRSNTQVAASDAQDAHARAEAAGDAAEAAAQAAGATAAEAEEARQVAMLKAFRGDEEIELDPTIQLSVGDERLSLEELQKNGLRHADYTRKTMQLADARRVMEEREQELQRLHARMEARNRALEERAQKLAEANADPDAYNRIVEHQQRMAEDPDYRAMVERAQRDEEREAMDSADAEIARQSEINAIRDDIADTAVTLASDPKYSGIDPERAMAVYGARLQAGQAELRESHLRKVFDDLAGERQQVLAPVQEEMASLRKELAELKAMKQAEAANGKVRRAATPRRATPAPVPSSTAASPISGSETSSGKRAGSFHAASQEWARAE